MARLLGRLKRLEKAARERAPLVEGEQVVLLLPPNGRSDGPDGKWLLIGRGGVEYVEALSKTQ